MIITYCVDIEPEHDILLLILFDILLQDNEDDPIGNWWFNDIS